MIVARDECRSPPGGHSHSRSIAAAVVVSGARLGTPEWAEESFSVPISVAPAQDVLHWSASRTEPRARGRFEAGGPSRVYEADLRSATRRMLQLHHKNRVAAEVSVKPAGWKAVGGVDIAVYGAKSGSAFDALFELKWGGNVEETLWDAWKLAALYKQGRRAWNVYLVSGAPVTTWVTAKPLARLWREGKYRSAELWRIAGTARWQPNVGPATVPAGVRIQELAAVPIQTQDKTAWELRVVRDDNTWQGMGSPPIGRVIDALDRRPSDVQG